MQKRNLQSNARSVYRYARVSPKKVMPVLKVIRNKRVIEAVKFLTFDTTKASKLTLKTLKSAVANAGQKGLSADNLVVSKAVVDTAPTAKRGRPGSRSHYSRILKRSSHITVEVGSKEVE